jgi:hypothetical protein
VAIERKGTRLGEDVPGDEAAGARGIPFREFEDEDAEFEFCFMGYPPLCPGWEDTRFGEDGGVVCIDTPFGQNFAATLSAGDSGWPEFETYSASPRIFRDGVASVCTPPKSPPGTFGAATYNFDLYYFQNCDGGEKCVTVNVDNGACGTNVHGVAFSGRFPAGTGYADMAGGATYIGDQGSSLTGPFSFVIPGGTTEWTLMMHNTANAAACAYSFDIVEN